MNDTPKRLGAVQRRVLAYLAEHGGGEADVELAMIGSNSSTTFSAIFALEEQGLIARVERRPERSIYGWARLTAAGLAHLEAQREAPAPLLRVFVGREQYIEGGAVRGRHAVVAVSDRHELARLLLISYSRCCDEWQATNDEAACAAARANPETVMVADSYFPPSADDYRPHRQLRRDR